MEVKKELNGTPLPQRNSQGGGNVAATPNAKQAQQSQPNNTPAAAATADQNSVDKKPNFINQKGGGRPLNKQRFGGPNNNRNNAGGGNRQGGGRRSDNENKGVVDRRGGGNNIGQNSASNNQGGGGGGGGGFGFRNDDRSRKSEDFMIQQKLKGLHGPTHELPSVEHEEIKFSGRNRLYVGNLPNDVKEEELKEWFKPYGDINEAFVNTEKNFAFLKVDFHANAERAKRELDGITKKNRQIRIRFAPNATTIRVKNLTPHVSNELLHKSFEIFGPVERAVIVVDDRGKPTGEGIVEYTRKSGAMIALRYCTEKCFFLTSSLRPCVVELFEHSDDTDGFPEKSLNRKTDAYFKARQNGPRFAESGSFEHEYGTRWKQLHELYKQKQDALKREMIMDEEKLEAQMEYARYEHETEMLREQLRARELDRDQRKTEWEMKERYAEEQRTKTEEQMRRSQDDMALRINRQEDELRRRQQENTLFMQAQQLMLDAQEMNQGAGSATNDRKNFNNNLGRNFANGNNQDSGFVDNRNNTGNHNNNRGVGGGSGGNRFDERNQKGNVGGGGNRGGGNNSNRNNSLQHWNNDRDGGFQNKRRRF